MVKFKERSLFLGLAVILCLVGFVCSDVYAAHDDDEGGDLVTRTAHTRNYSWVGTVGEGTGILLRTFGVIALAQQIIFPRLQDAPQDFVAASRKRLAATGCWGGSSLRIKIVPGINTVAAIRPCGSPWIPHVLIDPHIWATMNENQQYMVLSHEFGHLYNSDIMIKIAVFNAVPLLLWGLGRWACTRAYRTAIPKVQKAWNGSLYQRRFNATSSLAHSYVKKSPKLRRGLRRIKRARYNALVDWTWHKTAVVAGLHNATSLGDAFTLFLGRVAGGFWLGSRLFGTSPPGWNIVERMQESRADKFALSLARNAEDIVQFQRFFEKIDRDQTGFIVRSFVDDFVRVVKQQMDPKHPLPEERAARCQEALKKFKSLAVPAPLVTK